MTLRLQFGSRLRLRKSRNASIVKPILEVFNQLPINTPSPLLTFFIRCSSLEYCPCIFCSHFAIISSLLKS